MNCYQTIDSQRDENLHIHEAYSIAGSYLYGICGCSLQKAKVAGAMMPLYTLY